MSNNRRPVECPACATEVVPDGENSPDRTLNNVEKVNSQFIVLEVQCDRCNEVFKPVFTYTGFRKKD